METPLQITFKDMESSEALESMIRERVDRLERFHDRITGCRVVVDVPHRGAGSGKLPLGIRVEVDVPGRNTLVAYNAEERRDAKQDQLALIVRTFETIERKLRQVADVMAGDVKEHGSTVETGVVSRLFPDRNYGFIEIKGSPDLYFTRNAVVDGSFDELEVGTMVSVTPATTEGPMGPQASSVRRLAGKTSTA